MEDILSMADTPYMYLLDLVLQSPMLESLELMIGGEGFINDQKVNGDWPHLKKLKITGRASDADLDFIFKNDLGNMADQGPYLSALNSSKAFGSHYQSLVNVDLRDCLKISSCIVPDILCLCPKLEILQARHVYARNVAERGLWACQQLRELNIQFLMDPSEQDLQQLVFERLSTLVRLERLTLDYDRCGDYRHDVLHFCLDCGLGQLAGLQQLTYVWLYTPSYSSWCSNLGTEDVVWIVNNWKKLKTTSPNYNGSAKVPEFIEIIYLSFSRSHPRQICRLAR
ncbi:hypothetical protein BGX34_012201 [Mortierella sp. NVP85]|nr:hypothetical protein BGX34_012201 [Mortierella sp. NVP85]